MIGKLLRKRRRELKMTQEQAEEFTAIPQASISRYELGKNEIGIIEFIQLCRIYDMDFFKIALELDILYEENLKREDLITQDKNEKESRRIDE